MKKIITIALMLFACTIYSQITLIPDPNFEQYLINTGIDTDGVINGQVLTSDIDNIVNFAISNNPLIIDLTGIEDFSSLEFLNIFSVNITEINLTENLNLKRLDISDVSLNSLDLSSNVALEEFNLFLNSSSGIFTSSIDNINLSANTLLDHINISRANLSFLDFVNNVNITYLELYSMDNLTSINLKNGSNQNLLWLQIFNNQNLQCVQVDDPLAVIAGTNSPYDNWIIENNPIITDNCNLGLNEYLTNIINLYPNPVSNILYFNNNGIDIVKIEIYDVLGKKVLVTKGDATQIDISNLDNGLYLVNIQTDQGILVKKVIKE